jgi:hypothetical protein
VAKRRGDRHPDHALHRLAAGRESAGDRRRVGRHLLAGCTRCARWLAARLGFAGSPRLPAAAGPGRTEKPTAERAARPAARETDDPPGFPAAITSTHQADPDPLARVVARAAARFPELRAKVEAERRAAAALLARLDALPAARRRMLVANLESTATRAVCEGLLDRARARRHENAHDCLGWAELALDVARRVDTPCADELRARAWAEVGNARRIAGDLAGAGGAFAEAEKLVFYGCADPELRADLWSLEASLAHHRRDFAACEALLARAVAAYHRCGSRAGKARALVKLGQVRVTAGDPRAAWPAFARALAELGGTAEPALTRRALQNLVVMVAEGGDPGVAAGLLVRIRPLFGHEAPTLERLRLDWLEGRIALQAGAAGAAAAHLEAARRGFLDEAQPYEVALVSLELAAAYAALGRPEELAALVRESTALFSSLGVVREHLAGLLIAARLDAAESAGRVAALARLIAKELEAGRLARACQAKARNLPDTRS